MKICLTIAGSDCSGGAGIQADLKTFAAYGVYGMSVITAVVAENTTCVRGIHQVPPDMIAKQMDCNTEDFEINAVKIGMLGDLETMQVVAKQLSKLPDVPVVLDPVMVATSGGSLMECGAIAYCKEQLLPKTTVLTPNLPEAEALVGYVVDTIETMEQAAKDLVQMGVGACLVKGGHLSGDACDVLYDGEVVHHLTSKRIPSDCTHGTGCTLSSAIAANLALGNSVVEAVTGAKQYITKAIAYAKSIGHGNGPVHHLYEYGNMKGWN